MKQRRSYRYGTNPSEWAAHAAREASPCPSCEMSNGLKRILPVPTKAAPGAGPGFGLLMVFAVGMVILFRGIDPAPEIAEPQELPSLPAEAVVQS
jgi:hypothetical protein